MEKEGKGNMWSIHSSTAAHCAVSSRSFYVIFRLRLRKQPRASDKSIAKALTDQREIRGEK